MDPWGPGGSFWRENAQRSIIPLVNLPRGWDMKRFVEETARTQLLLLRESRDDYIGENNSVRAIESFVARLGLAEPGFEHVQIGCGGQGRT
jgi:hypothetical protein